MPRYDLREETLPSTKLKVNADSRSRALLLALRQKGKTPGPALSVPHSLLGGYSSCHDKKPTSAARGKTLINQKRARRTLRAAVRTRVATAPQGAQPSRGRWRATATAVPGDTATHAGPPGSPSPPAALCTSGRPPRAPSWCTTAARPWHGKRRASEQSRDLGCQVSGCFFFLSSFSFFFFLFVPFSSFFFLFFSFFFLFLF